MQRKIAELSGSDIRFVIICGERTDYPNVIYRKARGKWDAINFARRFVPDGTFVVALNDVDTTLCNLDSALECLEAHADLVYCAVHVAFGPQKKFYKILDPIRKRLHVAASGELMLVKKSVLDKVLPIPPCTAEDSYILFKALGLGYKCQFCSETYVTTSRTKNAREEEEYKARTTLGVYQALTYAKATPVIRLFYASLPLAAPLLALAGNDGRAWARGIETAVKARATRNFSTKF